MSGDSALLPDGFEALAPFTETWAIEGTANRAQRRTDSAEADRVAFYTVGKDVAASALDYLDRKPIQQFDARDRRLMNLLLSLCHISLAVEIQGDDEPKHSADRQYMKITKASADHDA
jgi:hypothetical protein